MRWSSLRTIGNTRVFTFTIFVPIIGYFILFNDYVLQFLTMSSIVNLNDNTQPIIHTTISDSTLFKLFCLYFGFTFLSIGNILYGICCPTIIKNHKRSIEFVESERDLYTDRDIKNMADHFLNQKLILSFDFSENAIQISNIIDAIHDGRYNSDDVSAMQIDLANLRHTRAQNLSNLMQDYFEFIDYGTLFSRWSVLALYTSGFLLIIIPSLLTFWHICMVFVRLVERVT